LLLALLSGEPSLSRWFLRYTRAAGIHLDAIYASRKFAPNTLAQIRDRRARGEALGSLPSHTSSATNMANGAFGLAQQTGKSVLGLRHLLGAYFYALPKEHQDQMGTWGFDGPRDGSAFVRQMRDRHRDELPAWSKVHTEVGGAPPDLVSTDPVPPTRVSGFAADTPEGDDYLDIEDDVYALSALVCSTKVSPPLSIGLFGDWGSGKSFFMRRLRRGVAWISGHARGSPAMQKDLPFYKNVVQIEFNAWNYSGGNLWAALVQHILENLRLSDEEAPGLVELRVAHLREQMRLEQAVREDAAARKEEAKRTVDALGVELNDLREKHDKEVEQLKATLAADVLQTVQLDPKETDELNRIRGELGLPATSPAAGEFLAAVDGTRRLLGRASALLRYVPRDQRTRFIIGALLVLLGPPVLALVIGAVTHFVVPDLAPISTAVSWVSATLAGGAGWLRDRARALDESLANLERLQAHARQRVEAKERENRAEAARLEQRIALAKDEILAAQAREQEATSRLQQITAQIAATTPASVLADFVRERSQSEDYRRHLGLPAVIRRDFESISRLVAEENQALLEMKTSEEERANAERRVNRIVLYIDDLDRCPELLVVEVLQAVHLLLAFPLFVVVVAVDARWVSHSLARHFPGLLTAAPPGSPSEPKPHGPDHATPSDYLEKIFQIPFWLRQPADKAVKRMVRGLVNEGSPAVTPDPVPVPDPGRQPESSEPAGVFRHRQHDPKATSLDIGTEEREYMEGLAPLLGRSPRALKRFVNVYRLLKASLPPEEAGGFLDQQEAGRGPYQDVLLLLALVTGLPALSDELLGALAPAQPNTAVKNPVPATLGTALAAVPRTDEDVRQQADQFTAWLNTNWPGWNNVSLTRFSDWVLRVGRYSYHFQRD
jgi:hypothetical protein